MNTKQRNEISHVLSGRPYGWCDGARIYKVCRGFYQVQHATKPHLSSYNGTKREIERAMKHTILPDRL